MRFTGSYEKAPPHSVSTDFFVDSLKEVAEKKQEELRRQKEKDRQRGGHRRDEPGDSALGMGLEFDSFLSR